MDREKNLPRGEKICLNTEEKNLSESFFDMFMVAQVFDAKEPKSEIALQYHCDLIILSDMLKQGRYDQVKKIIDRATEKIACLETIMGLFDSWEDD